MAIAAFERPVERRLRTVAPLVVDDGCDVRVRGGVQDAVRVALLEWLPPTTAELRVVEAGHQGDAPAHALAALVRPPTIWTMGEALTEPSHTQLGNEHLSRLRGAAARLERQLPVAGFQVASAAVARGCAAIAADDGACAAVALALLARYFSSALVSERRRRLHLP